MKKNKILAIKIIKDGKDIPSKDKNINEKVSKQKTYLMYLIPLIILVTLGFVYIFTQLHILLIPFAILMFIVLLGLDGSTRTCPNCKKWNSTIWIKNESISEVRENNIGIKRSIIFGRQTDNKRKSKQTKIKYIISQGKCKNCGCIYERKKQRLLL